MVWIPLKNIIWSIGIIIPSIWKYKIHVPNHQPEKPEIQDSDSPVLGSTLGLALGWGITWQKCHLKMDPMHRELIFTRVTYCYLNSTFLPIDVSIHPSICEKINAQIKCIIYTLIYINIYIYYMWQIEIFPPNFFSKPPRPRVGHRALKDLSCSKSSLRPWPDGRCGVFLF